ncbi:hypothetical protein [Tengunoibacter tsumagoiensis]|uniref:3-keto-disaccharide hydrolase domain-containing protein n=1 Tax=Tengunoibacter tsumagoiensis TaxID=2014871 RepID=A0A402A911_9CHLR|nr:hypothetical protein [Tengunoibacter tsumagoiensis]GCE15633.1 hypothetical protein KTT_54920 [Tengunoibacter tsumagoiensis]
MPDRNGVIAAAIITTIGAIIVAIIGGLFLLIHTPSSQNTSSTPVPPFKPTEPSTPIPQFNPTESSTPSVVATSSVSDDTDFSRRLTELHLSQIWSDSLSNQSAELWDDDQTYCTFQNGAYQVTHPDNVTQTCYAKHSPLPLNHFAFEAQMTILDGNSGGILFGDKQGVQYYFTLDYNGYYTLFYHPQTNAPSFPCTTYCTKPGIAVTGYHHPNLLGIIVNGTHIEMYINRHLIYSVEGVNIPNTGTVGLLAVNKGQSTVQFQNAKVWS